MSHPITEVAASANFSTGITVPDTGDDFDDIDDIFATLLQQLGDRCKALSIASIGATAAKISIPMVPITNQGNYLEPRILTGSIVVVQNIDAIGTTTTLGSFFALPAIAPGVKIVSIVMGWSGGSLTGNSHGGLPASMPSVILKRQTTGSNVDVGSQTDTSASVGTYDAAHEVTLTVNHTVVSGSSYYLKVIGESGSNAVDNYACLYGLWMNVAPA